MFNAWHLQHCVNFKSDLQSFFVSMLSNIPLWSIWTHFDHSSSPSALNLSYHHWLKGPSIMNFFVLNEIWGKFYNYWGQFDGLDQLFIAPLALFYVAEGQVILIQQLSEFCPTIIVLANHFLFLFLNAMILQFSQ